MDTNNKKDAHFAGFIVSPMDRLDLYQTEKLLVKLDEDSPLYKRAHNVIFHAILKFPPWHICVGKIYFSAGNDRNL